MTNSMMLMRTIVNEIVNIRREMTRMKEELAELKKKMNEQAITNERTVMTHTRGMEPEDWDDVIEQLHITPYESEEGASDAVSLEGASEAASEEE